VEADADAIEVVLAGNTDFKGELRRQNRELLFAYLDLLDRLVERPSAYARCVENIGVVARNMHYLLNALRAHQVCGLNLSPLLFFPVCFLR
jgi:hypothetical protein